MIPDWQRLQENHWRRGRVIEPEVRRFEDKLPSDVIAKRLYEILSGIGFPNLYRLCEHGF